MITLEECKRLEYELEEARKEYNATHEPCHNISCAFYRERSDNHCTWHHYVEECNEYKEEEK